MSIQDGLMHGIERRLTGVINPNIPSGSMWPKFIINHIMQGYQSTMINWADQRPPVNIVAAHFSIGRTGRIVQHKSIWDPGYHVAWGNYNSNSVGIEHEGFSVHPVAYTPDYIYSAERPWPTVMIDASIAVHKWVVEAVRTYDPTFLYTIIGHNETGQPDRIHDPGQLWLEQVKPRILAAFDPPVTVDDFQRGRKEMYEAMMTMTFNQTVEVVALLQANQTRLERLRNDWGIR